MGGGRAGPNNIVVAVDGSEHARQALAWALSNVYQEGDVIHLIHSLDLPSRWYMLDARTTTMYDELEAETRKQAELMLDLMCKIVIERGARLGKRMLIDTGKDGVCDFVEAENASMLVLGSRGLGTLKRAFVGSFSDYCLHQCSCPVAIVKTPSRDQTPGNMERKRGAASSQRATTVA